LGPTEWRPGRGSGEAQAASPQKSIFGDVTLLVEINLLFFILRKIILVGNGRFGSWGQLLTIVKKCNMGLLQKRISGAFVHELIMIKDFGIIE
jgi:hypothetical protein